MAFLNEILNFRPDALCSSAIAQNQIWVSAMFWFLKPYANRYLNWLILFDSIGSKFRVQHRRIGGHPLQHAFVEVTWIRFQDFLRCSVVLKEMNIWPNAGPAKSSLWRIFGIFWLLRIGSCSLPRLVPCTSDRSTCLVALSGRVATT